MKNYKKLTLTALILFMLPFGLYATELEDESNNGSSKPLEVRRQIEERKVEFEKKRVEMQEKRELIKANFEEKKEAIKNGIEQRREAVNEKVKERLEKFINILIERFTAAQERLAELASRIESRLAKMEADGLDVSAQKTALASAKVLIGDLTQSISEIETMSTEVLTGETRALYPELKEAVEATKSEIKTAHQALVDIIVSLKGMSQKSDQ